MRPLDFFFFKISSLDSGLVDENLIKHQIFQELQLILRNKEGTNFFNNFFYFFDNFFKPVVFKQTQNFSEKIEELIKSFSLKFFDKIFDKKYSELQLEINLLNKNMSAIALDLSNNITYKKKDPIYNFFYTDNFNDQYFDFLLNFLNKDSLFKEGSFSLNFFEGLQIILNFKNVNDSFFFNKTNNFWDLSFKKFDSFNDEEIKVKDKFFLYDKLFALVHLVFDLLPYFNQKGLVLNEDNKFFFKIFFYQLFFSSFSIKIFDDNFFILFLDFLDNITQVFKKVFGYFLFFFQKFEKSAISTFVDKFLGDFDAISNLLFTNTFFLNLEWFWDFILALLSSFEQNFDFELPLDLLNLSFNLLLRQVISFFSLFLKNNFNFDFVFFEMFDMETVFLKTVIMAEEFASIGSKELKNLYGSVLDFAKILETTDFLKSLKSLQGSHLNFLDKFFLRKLFKRFHKIVLKSNFREGFFFEGDNSILYFINFLLKIFFNNVDDFNSFHFFDNPFLLKLNNLLHIISCFSKTGSLFLVEDSSSFSFLIDKFSNKKFPFLNFSFFLSCLRFIRVSYGYPLHFFASLDKLYSALWFLLFDSNLSYDEIKQHYGGLLSEKLFKFLNVDFDYIDKILKFKEFLNSNSLKKNEKLFFFFFLYY